LQRWLLGSKKYDKVWGQHAIDPARNVEDSVVWVFQYVRRKVRRETEIPILLEEDRVWMWRYRVPVIVLVTISWVLGEDRHKEFLEARMVVI
jgi:hypothetical protein